jgi:hypothetical protein
MSAATGINWSTGRNFTMNANATVTNGTSGNITITAGGDITMLASPGSLANAPEIVNNASGGAITLTVGAGKTLTVNSTGTTAIESNAGVIFLTADAMVIAAGINSGTAATALHNASAGQAISLGGVNAGGVLGLTQAELNEITAGVTRIGTSSAGSITISSPISNPTNSNVLALINNGTISEKPFGSLTLPNLRVSSTGPVTLDNPNNNIQFLAADTTNGLTVNDGAHNLTVGIVEGDFGVVTNNSAINLTADAMNFQQQVNAGTGIVTLSSFSPTQAIALGVANQAGLLGLTAFALAEVTASVLRVNGNGNISLAGTVARHAGYNTLSLTTGNNISQTAALSVANLALNSESGIALTNSGNDVDTLAFTNAGGAVSYTDSNALTIGAVDGIASSSNTGTATTISVAGNLFLAVGLSSSGTTTLTSTTGVIVDGDNGADVDVTAPTLGLSASTGMLLQTQVGAIGAQTATGGIFINNGSAAPVTLNIGTGGVGVQVTGASGDIVLTNNGTIDSLTSDANINGPTNITVLALGANADINFGGQASSFTIYGSGSGLVNVEAGRDMNLGNGAGFGAIRNGTGSINLVAGRNMTIDPNAYVEVFGGNGGITATAGGNFTMTTSPGTLGDDFVTFGGAIALFAGASGTMTLASTATNAASSNGGNITLTADFLNINQGVNASTGNVLLQQASAGQLISLGTATGGLNLTNTELNLVTAKNLTVGNVNTGLVTLGGTVNPTHVTNLTINTGGSFTAGSSSAINVGSGVLTIGFGENGLGATADLQHSSNYFASTFYVTGGTGDDTFLVGSAFPIFTGGGGADTFQGTASAFQGDTITDFSRGDKIVITDGNLAHFSFSLNGNTLSVDPDTSVSQIFRTITLSNAPVGHLIATADPVVGVDLTFEWTPPNDFAAEQHSDVLFQNPTTGDTGYWTTDPNGMVTGFHDYGTAAPGYPVVGVADFNGDGKSDVLFENKATGDTGYWITDAKGTVTGFHDYGAAAPGYLVVGTEYFDASGHPEVLFENQTTGDTGYWITDARGTVTGFHDYGTAGPGYLVVGTGYLDTSGHPEVLFQNSSTGDTGYWITDAKGTVTGFHDYGTAAPGYLVVGTGYFDASGHAEVLFQNSTTGDTGYWITDAKGTVTGFHDYGTAAPGYLVVGAGDYDGDGRSDVLPKQSHRRYRLLADQCRWRRHRFSRFWPRQHRLYRFLIRRFHIDGGYRCFARRFPD